MGTGTEKGYASLGKGLFWAKIQKNICHEQTEKLY